MGTKSKKKKIIYILTIILTLSPVIASVGTIGIVTDAIISFVDRVVDFFEDIWDSIVDFFSGTVKFEDMTLEQLIKVVKESERFDEQLEDMHIDKDTFIYLLEKVEKYNNRPNGHVCEIELISKKPNPDFVMEKEHQKMLRDFIAAGQLDMVEILMRVLDEQFYHGQMYIESSIYVPCLLVDDSVQYAQIDWQYLFLFSQYYSALSMLEEDAEWNITKETVDYVYEYIEPVVSYKTSELIDTKEPVRLTQAEILSNYSELNSFRYEVTEEDGSVTVYTGYGPTILPYSVDTLYEFRQWHEVYYDFKRSWGSSPIAYLDKFYECVDALTRGFDWDIFFEHLSALPGSEYTVDEMVVCCYKREKLLEQLEKAKQEDKN